MGKIHSVVRRRDSSSCFFQFYNLLEYPDHPPSLGSSSFKYHQCDAMMSTSEKVTGIKWTAKSSVARKRRPHKSYFDREYAPARRGLYDKEDQLESLRIQQKTRQESESDSSSSSSDGNDVPTRKLSKERRRQVYDTSSSSDSESAADSDFECTSIKLLFAGAQDGKYWIEEER